MKVRTHMEILLKDMKVSTHIIYTVHEDDIAVRKKKLSLFFKYRFLTTQKQSFFIK